MLLGTTATMSLLPQKKLKWGWEIWDMAWQRVRGVSSSPPVRSDYNQREVSVRTEIITTSKSPGRLWWFNTLTTTLHRADIVPIWCTWLCSRDLRLCYRSQYLENSIMILKMNIESFLTKVLTLSWTAVVSATIINKFICMHPGVCVIKKERGKAPIFLIDNRCRSPGWRVKGHCCHDDCVRIKGRELGGWGWQGSEVITAAFIHKGDHFHLPPDRCWSRELLSWDGLDLDTTQAANATKPWWPLSSCSFRTSSGATKVAVGGGGATKTQNVHLTPTIHLSSTRVRVAILWIIS